MTALFWRYQGEQKPQDSSQNNKVLLVLIKGNFNQTSECPYGHSLSFFEIRIDDDLLTQLCKVACRECLQQWMDLVPRLVSLRMDSTSLLLEKHHHGKGQGYQWFGV